VANGQPFLKSPFPYFGAKSRIASEVWARFGDAPNYVEPFFGSGAVLLNRPEPFDGVETVNDADGLVSNFWRALQADPDAVAHHADWPVNENDLHARHVWLVGVKDSLQAKLEGDHAYFDVKVAGWWVWGMACWIGREFCSGKGPWQVVDRQLVHLGDAGRGVNRQRVHLGDAGRGVNRQRVHLGDAGQGVKRKRVDLQAYMRALADRMRDVRVCCGDWTRVMGEAPTVHQGTTAIFLDPPYADTAGRDETIYRVDCSRVAHAVREWAIAHGDDKRYRIALCGYDGEHAMPPSWECVAWKAQGGYGSQSTEHDNPNAKKERIWFSPHCINVQHQRMPLFSFITEEPPC